MGNQSPTRAFDGVNKIPMKTTRPLTYLLALCASTLLCLAGDPTGKWTFHAEGPKGKAVDSTLELRLADKQLTGSIDNKAGKTAISKASFENEEVRFSVVREIRRRSVEVKYAGKLDGDTIKGSVEIEGRGDRKVTVPWEAHRSK